MTTDNNALSQAIAQANSITAMVGALNVDYGRLEELRDSQKRHIEEMFKPGGEYMKPWASFAEAKELAELEEAAGDCKDADEARGRIQEDALDVQVREDWKAPGETSTPSEFQILLCTGGPAVRIMGELDDYMQPVRAWLEYQDWGTPWTHAVGVIEQSTLLEYCQQFYFGE